MTSSSDTFERHRRGMHLPRYLLQISARQSPPLSVYSSPLLGQTMDHTGASHVPSRVDPTPAPSPATWCLMSPPQCPSTHNTQMRSLLKGSAIRITARRAWRARQAQPNLRQPPRQRCPRRPIDGRQTDRGISDFPIRVDVRTSVRISIP